MILDARKGDWHWWVWHCPTCTKMPRVVWVDDETAEYGELVTNEKGGIAVIAGKTMLVTRKVRKIRLVPGPRLVLIDPLEDNDEATLTEREIEYVKQRQA